LFWYSLGLLVIYAAAAWRFPLLTTYDIQIFTLELQAKDDEWLGPGLTLGILLLFALYGAGFLALRNELQQPQRSLWALLIGVPLVGSGLLLTIHPTTSLDLYDYLYRGHMAARYGANNFIQSPEDLRALDRLYWYTAWRRATTAYGPLWEIISTTVARFSGAHLWNLIVGFKLNSWLGWLLCGLAIMLTSQAVQRPLSLYLWFWNPLVLWELVGAGHNDGWMLFFGVLAYWALPRRPALALVLLTLGTLIKYALALLWPVFLVAALSRLPTWRGRVLFALRAGMLCVTLTVLAYLPWWAGEATLEQLRERGELFANSPLALARAIFGTEETTKELDPLLMQIGLGLLAVGMLIALWRAWRKPEQLPFIGAGLLLWFMLVASAWYQPWYLTWPIALLALRPEQGRWQWLAGGLALGSILLYPAAASLRPWLDWPGDGVAWQALVLLLMYLPAVGFILYHYGYIAYYSGAQRSRIDRRPPG
jgi:hypothetical protein